MRTITFIFAFLLCAGFVQAQENSLNQTDSLNRKQGHWIVYGKDRPELQFPENGKVEEGDYVNDLKQGTWAKYYEDGKTIKLIGVYVDDRPRGAYTKYHANGRLKETGHFQEKKYLDSVKRYYENGQLEYEAWFDQNGKEQGALREYHPNGRIERQAEMVDGMAKQCERFDSNGNFVGTCESPICTISFPIVSPEDSLMQFEAHRKIVPPKISELPNTSGVTLNRNGYNKIFNQDKEIWIDGVYQEGKLWDGKMYLYDRDGILLAVLLYKDGVYIGDGIL